MKPSKLFQKYVATIASDPFLDFPTKAFTCTPVKYFFVPIGGYVQARGSSITRSELKKLELFFDSYKPKSFIETKTPFFCALDDQLSVQTRNLLTSFGWSESLESQQFNIFTKLRELNLPPGYSFSIFDQTCSSQLDQHTKLVGNVFKSKEIGNLLLKYFKEVKVKGYIVNIISSRGKVVATGSVVFQNQIGALFSGCVDPKHQGKGLWNALVAARQACSATHGVKSWYLTTSTKAILYNSDESYSYKVWTKS